MAAMSHPSPEVTHFSSLMTHWPELVTQGAGGAILPASLTGNSWKLLANTAHVGMPSDQWLMAHSQRG